MKERQWRKILDEGKHVKSVLYPGKKIIKVKYLIKEDEQKIYVPKGQKTPKGKKLQTGPRGGQYFMGSAEEKENYGKSPDVSKKAPKKSSKNAEKKSKKKDWKKMSEDEQYEASFNAMDVALNAIYAAGGEYPPKSGADFWDFISPALEKAGIDIETMSDESINTIVSDISSEFDEDNFSEDQGDWEPDYED